MVGLWLACMFGCRTAFGVGCCALFAVLVGCGGSVVHGGPPEEGSAGVAQGGATQGTPGGTHAGSRNMGGKPSVAGSGGALVAGSGGVAGEPEPVETGCPPQELPPPDLQCDPFAPGSCGAGAGCYPFVEHPEGNGCDQQHYGTVCLPIGVGRQGDVCGDDSGDFCAEGFVCVVGQRAGKRCAQLCRLGEPKQCSGGLLCGDLDVAGFGVCG